MALPRTVTVADVLTQANGSPEIGVIKIARRVDLRAGVDGAGPGIITAGQQVARLAPDGSFTLTVYANDDPQWSPQGWSHRITIALLGSTTTYDVLLPYQAGAYTLAELLPLLSPTAGAMYAPIGHTHEGGGGGGSTAWADLTGVPATFPPSAHTHIKADVGLGNVDNTSDAAKPVSTAQAAALAAKAPLASPAFTGTVTGITAGMVGLGNVNNTSDAAKPISTAQAAALAAKADLVAGVIPTSQIPAVALVEYLGTAANQAAMLAKVGQPGDWVNRTDLGTTWQITGSDPTLLGSWTELLYPASPVQSVAGRTGAVTLAKTDVGLGNVDNTSDANKPVSTAQAAALATKAPLASPAFTGTVTGITAGMVGLGNVDNTSDAAKPVSTAQAAALAGKVDKSVLTTKGDLFVATGPATIARIGVGANGEVLTADSATATGTKWAAASGGGGGTAATFVRAYVTTGDLIMPNDAAWAPVAGLALALPAVVGDDVELFVNCMLHPGGGGDNFYDPVVLVGGAIVRAASTGTATPAVEGDPALYPSTNVLFRGSTTSFGFTVTSDDLSGGNVTFGIAHKGAGGGTPKIYAGTAYPFRWRARNDH